MTILPMLTTGAETAFNPMLLVVWGAMFLFMWFVLIRPQRKRQKETEQLQKSIEVGDPVVLTSGMYGKVVDTVNNVLIIELGTNKSVRVPVQRSAVVGKSEPDLSIVKEKEIEEK